MSTDSFWLSKAKSMALSLLWAALLTLLMLAPEWLFSQIYTGFIPYWEGRVIAVLYLLNLLAITSYYRRTALVVIGFLYFLQLTALVNYAYFGSFYSPSDVMLLFFESKEVFVSLAGVVEFIWLPMVVVAGLFAIFVLIHRRIREQLAWSRISSVLLLVLLAAPAIDASMQDRSQKYEPDATQLAIKNALYSASYFVGNALPRRIRGEDNIKHYQPYIVQQAAPLGKYHVVLLMGESLTYSRMSLFGYERKTTPYLERLHREGKLIERKGMAAAVSTRVSVPMFMNVQYEPDNWTHISSKKSSMFKLAKQSGYQTVFISSQMMDGTSALMGGQFIDHWRDERDKGACRYDNCLTSMIDSVALDWSAPAFVVLNQRSAHSPYQDNYPPEFAEFSKTKSNDMNQYRRDTYDDAVRYVDQNVEHIVTHLQKISTLPVVIVMTADHGEKLGENGEFGHNTLDLPTGRVPFVLIADPALTSVTQAAHALPAILPHFEMARFTARLLGYDIDTPSRRENEYFLNGADLMGRAGFMPYRVNELPEARTQLAKIKSPSK